MPLYAIGDRSPAVDPLAFVHPDAVLIGSVEIGAESTVWPGAVLRAEHGRIVVGARTSIQDGTVVHCTDEQHTFVGDECVVGHIVHLEGCTIEDRSLVGSGAVVLQRVVVRTGALVGAGALVTEGMEVPTGAMALGVPARLREGALEPGFADDAVKIYVENGRHYRTALRRLDP